MRIRNLITALLIFSIFAPISNATEALKIAACEAFPPFTYAAVVNGKEDISKPAGFDSEIIDEIFKANSGLKIKSFKIYPWKNGLNGTFAVNTMLLCLQ